MDYKLKNGFTMEILKCGKKGNDTYFKIEASGYHGDMDYEVNRDTKLYFNDDNEDFKNLICFECFRYELGFDELKQEFQKLFENKEDFEYMREEWADFCEDYSEMHDRTISLDLECLYVIEGTTYDEADIRFEFINPES